MGVTEYRETIDYTWVVSRQLDRVAEALSRINYNTPGIGARRLYMAVEALVTVAGPFVTGEAWEKLRAAERLLNSGKPLGAVELLEEAVHAVLRDLDRRGVLIRKTELLTGAYGGGD